MVTDNGANYRARTFVRIGDYTVLLSRQDANAPWLAERITPPETAG